RAEVGHVLGSDDFGRYTAPALSTTGLVRQGLPDDRQRGALCSDFLNNAVCSCQPLPGPGIWCGRGWGAASKAHLGSGELVTRPDLHANDRIGTSVSSWISWSPTWFSRLPRRSVRRPRCSTSTGVIMARQSCQARLWRGSRSTPAPACSAS